MSHCCIWPTAKLIRSPFGFCSWWLHAPFSLNDWMYVWCPKCRAPNVNIEITFTQWQTGRMRGYNVWGGCTSLTLLVTFIVASHYFNVLFIILSLPRAPTPLNILLLFSVFCSCCCCTIKPSMCQTTNWHNVQGDWEFMHRWLCTRYFDYPFSGCSLYHPPPICSQF